MSKKKEKVKGWPADEEHWRQWLPKNYGEFPQRWSGDGSEIDNIGAEIGISWRGDRFKYLHKIEGSSLVSGVSWNDRQCNG